MKDHPEVTIEYFVPDERKAGGAYVSVSGVMKRISSADKTMTMEIGEVIPIDEIAFAE